MHLKHNWQSDKYKNRFTTERFGRKYFNVRLGSSYIKNLGGNILKQIVICESFSKLLSNLWVVVKNELRQDVLVEGI